MLFRSKLQDYYGRAIRSCVDPNAKTDSQIQNALDKMSKAIDASLLHCIKLSDPKQRHEFCNKTWCLYKKFPNKDFKNQEHHLDPVFLEFLRPTYEKMKIPNLLRRCLPGFSQNQNESLNSLVWVRAPKHKFHGKNVIETAAWSATLHFNNGASAREEVMLQASIPCGRHTVAGSDRKDKNRIIQSIKKATVKKKQRRLKIQLARSREEERRLDAEGTPSYLSGGFNDLETVVEPQSKRKRKN